MYLNLCNDIRRLILVYLLSIPIETFLSGKKEAIVEFKADLLNDILSVIFYYEIVKVHPLKENSNEETIFKTVCLLTINGYLTNGFIDYNKVIAALLINVGLHHVSLPILNKLKSSLNIDLSNAKGSLETVILLSLANNSIYDTIAKSLSLMLFQYFLKW